MAGSKSTQTRFVGIITSTIHPYACFLSSFNNNYYYADKLTSNPTIITITSQKFSNRIFSHTQCHNKHIIESKRSKEYNI